MKKIKFYHWCLFITLIFLMIMFIFSTKTDYSLCGKVVRIDKEYYGKYVKTRNVLYLLKKDNTVEKLQVDDTTYILKKVGDNVCFKQSKPTPLGIICIVIISLSLMIGFLGFLNEL